MKGDDIFKMSQKEGETLEDYVSRFLFNVQRNTQHNLNEESKKHLFLRGVQEESMEALDLMAGGDVTQKTWNDIKEICQNYSRATMKKGRGLRSLPHKTNGGSGASKMELSNLLFDFKQDIINDVTTQLDTMQAQRKKDKVDAMLTKFFSHCRERKKNYTCKTIAIVNAQPMPTETKKLTRIQEK